MWKILAQGILKWISGVSLT